MEERADDIEADLLAHFGVDLLDFWSGRMSIRRLRVLLRRLPATSCTVAAMRADPRWREAATRHKPSHEQAEAVEHREWGVAEHLLADIADQLAIGNWTQALIHRKKGAPAPKAPPRIPRPGVPDDVDRDGRKRISRTPTRPPAEVKLYLDAFRPPPTEGAPA